jgi:hypothetical protein
LALPTRPASPPPFWGAINHAPLGILAVLCAVFAAVGVGTVTTELVRLVTWRPVTATVLSTDVRLERGAKHPTFRPVVVYRYDVDGRDYQADRVTPVAYAGSRGWAEAAVRPYEPGQTVTAYVNPANPGSAYLLHGFDFRLFPILAVPLCLLAFVGGLAHATRAHAPAPGLRPVPIFGPGKTA